MSLRDRVDCGRLLLNDPRASRGTKTREREREREKDGEFMCISYRDGRQAGFNEALAA